MNIVFFLKMKRLLKHIDTNFWILALKKPLNKVEMLLGPGLDLEYETDVQTSAPEPALYETAYVTSHKAQCRSGAFSPDGQLVATGSVDASIKVSPIIYSNSFANP